jgi:hypothetical protein
MEASGKGFYCIARSVFVAWPEHYDVAAAQTVFHVHCGEFGRFSVGFEIGDKAALSSVGQGAANNLLDFSAMKINARPESHVIALSGNKYK